jgi:hypothetical protein
MSRPAHVAVCWRHGGHSISRPAARGPDVVRACLLACVGHAVDRNGCMVNKQSVYKLPDNAACPQRLR